MRDRCGSTATHFMVSGMCIAISVWMDPEEPMSNQKDKGAGVAQQVVGRFKQGIGKVIGNERMEAEGKAQELEGRAREEAAKAAERSKGKVEQVVRAIKNRAGAVIDDELLQAEGKAQELKGEARQTTNE